MASLQREHSSLQMSHSALEMDLVATRSAVSQLTTDMTTLQCRYDALKVREESGEGGGVTPHKGLGLGTGLRLSSGQRK